MHVANQCRVFRVHQLDEKWSAFSEHPYVDVFPARGMEFEAISPKLGNQNISNPSFDTGFPLLNNYSRDFKLAPFSRTYTYQ